MFKKKTNRKCGVECAGKEKLVMLEKTETNIKGGWTWNQCKNYTERHSNSLFSIFVIEQSFSGFCKAFTKKIIFESGKIVASSKKKKKK